ncbi:unnamed protein product [Musa acuminata var. zebrina]
MAGSPVQERGVVVQDSTKDRAKLDGMCESILCACCSTSYPSYWWNPETYPGPAALLHSNRYALVFHSIFVNSTFALGQNEGSCCKEFLQASSSQEES